MCNLDVDTVNSGIESDPSSRTEALFGLSAITKDVRLLSIREEVASTNEDQRHQHMSGVFGQECWSVPGSLRLPSTCFKHVSLVSPICGQKPP
jgi:hypothetical protein